MPHGVAVTEIAGIHEIIQEYPETESQFQTIFGDGHLAQNTIKTYDWVIRDFTLFCRANSCPYPFFDSKTVLRFLCVSVLRHRTYSFYRKLSPALRSLEKTLGLEYSSFNQTIRTALSCLKRLSAKHKPPVRKAVPFGRKHLSKMIKYVVLIPEAKGIPINMLDFRSVIRSIIIFYTWIRFSDYVILTDHMIEDCGDYIKISLPRSKQDQYYGGTCSYISDYDDKEYCPVRLIRKYFTLTSLTFGYVGLKSNFLCCRFQNKKGTYRALLSTTVCYDTAVKGTRTLLTSIGFEGHLYSETSFKSGGVTEFLDTGMSLTSTMLHGRWANEKTVIYYRRDSPEYRLKLCRKLKRINDSSIDEIIDKKKKKSKKNKRSRNLLE